MPSETNKKPLSLWPVSKKALLQAYKDDQLGAKMMSMGVMPMSSIEILRKSSLGQTFIVQVNEKMRFAIRKSEADHIIVGQDIIS